MGEFVVADVEIDMAAGGFHYRLHGVGDAGGGIDVEGSLPTAEVHAADEAGKTEEVVAVEVCDADDGAGLEALAVDAYLGLCVLTTIKEDAESVDVDHLPATVAGGGGKCGTGAEDCGVEVHC